LNAFGALPKVLDCAAALEVKKLATGLAWWKDRTGADLKADFEIVDMLAVSRKGCRKVKAILG
jgi:hypothetical protein